MSTRAADYSFEPLDVSPAGIEAVAGLMREVFPDATHLNPRYLRWQYVENPSGSAVGFNAISPKGDLAAHYATIPVKWHCGGKIQDCLLSLNTATHSAHRRRGLFSSLAARTYELGEERGFHYVWGVGNQYSTKGLLKLGFQEIGPLDVRIGIGRLAKTQPAPYRAVWSGELLRWRLQRPGANYWVEMRSGSAVVCGESGYPGLKVALLDGTQPGVLPRERRARLTTWVGHDLAREWEQVLYWRVPSALKPRPLNLVCLRVQETEPIPHPDQISMAALDFDAF